MVQTSHQEDQSFNPPSVFIQLVTIAFIPSLRYCNVFPRMKKRNTCTHKIRVSRNIGQVFGKMSDMYVRVFLVLGSSEVRESCVHPFRPNRICWQVGKSLTAMNTMKIYDSQSDRQNDKWLICKCLFPKKKICCFQNLDGKIQGNKRRGSVLRGGCKKLKCLKKYLFYCVLLISLLNNLNLVIV